MDAASFQLMMDTRVMVEQQEKAMSEKINELKDEIEAHVIKSDHRHKEMTDRIDNLSKSIISYMEKTPNQIVDRIEELIDEAFPEDPEIPDATPSEKRKLHRKYHAKLIATALRDLERRDSIVDKFISHVVNNAASIIGMALLFYFGVVHK